MRRLQLIVQGVGQVFAYATPFKMLGLVLLAAAAPNPSSTCAVSVTTLVAGKPTPGVELYIQHGRDSTTLSLIPKTTDTKSDADGKAIVRVPKEGMTYIVGRYPGADSNRSGVSCEYPETTVRLSWPEAVSILQLIANPERWHGRIVQVTGYVEIQFEGTAVYLRKEDARRGLSKNGIWLRLDAHQMKTCMKSSKQYAFVRGRFDGTNQGHMGLFSGALRDVSRCSPKANQRLPIRNKTSPR